MVILMKQLNLLKYKIMGKNSIFIVCLAFLFLSSCFLMFRNETNPIPNEYKPNLETNEQYVFNSFDDLLSDTFQVGRITFTTDEMDENDKIIVGLYSIGLDEKRFLINVNPISTIISNKYQFWSIIYSEETIDFAVNEILYESVYKWEEKPGGDSDTLINKLLYHPKTGILGYRYENGDEYLLDTIIKVE